MEDLLGRVRRDARRYGLFSPDETVVVGVSGGPDSLCLLHLLRRLAPELRLWLHVAHLDHSLRGEASHEDAAFVAELADCWGLPCTVGRADVIALADASRLSLEEAGREARYRFLAEVAENGGARTIAVAHNADDQAETVLMHFLRGSGVAGLRGMLPKAPLAEYRLFDPGSVGEDAQRSAEAGEHRIPSAPPHSRAFVLVRPLLTTSRAEIELYCAVHDLQPRYDHSNEDTTFFRNRLRHELLPILEQYNPRIREVLAHTGEVAAGDYQVLRAELEAAWWKVILSDVESEESQADIRFSLPAWRGLSLGLQRATIREAIHRLRRSLRNINWEHVERAVWLAREGHTGQAATLAAGLELQIGYGTLRIADEGAAWETDVPRVSAALSLAAPGVTEIGGGWQVSVQRLGRADLPADFAADADPWTAFLDAGDVGPTLTLRSRQPGDRFQPQGLGGHTATLREFMINARVARDVRDGWPLLIGEPGIVWVCGVRVDERAVVRDTTAAVWYVQFEKSPACLP